MFIFNFLFIFIKLSYSIVYVDIKSLYITQGILVYHGYFGKTFPYKMFVGENESIQMVKYGSQVMYVAENDYNSQYDVIVEYYGSNVEYVIVHVSIMDNTGIEKNKTLRFDIEAGNLFSINSTPIRIRNLIVRLSVDINEDAKNHPFIVKKVIENNDYTEIKFCTLFEFRGLRFNRSHEPRYIFGYVYDSSVDALIGFGIFKELISVCNTLSMEIRKNFVCVKMEYKGNDGEFIKVFLKNRYYWDFYGNDLFLNTEKKRKAFWAGKKIKDRRMLQSNDVLDLAERVSPGFYDIEKSTGTVDSFKYTLYRSKVSIVKIPYITDTFLRFPVVYHLQQHEKVFSVELYDDSQKTVIVISLECFLTGKGIMDTKIMERTNGNNDYKNICGKEKDKKLKMIKELGKINLSVNIDAETTRVYKNVKLEDNLFNFSYLYIDGVDEFEKEHKDKFNFGKVSEIEPYEGLNIPRENFKTDERIICDKLNCSEFLILNPFNVKPFYASCYEIYVPME